MVRTMKPLKETENIEMNRKVLEALIALGCYRKEAFLVAFKGCFNLYLGDRVRSGLTRTDLKQISRIADKMGMDRPVDVHQPLQVHALEKSPLIKRAKVPLSKLRLAIWSLYEHSLALGPFIVRPINGPSTYSIFDLTFYTCPIRAINDLVKRSPLRAPIY